MIDPSASVQAGMRGSLYGPEDITAARELGFTVLSTARAARRWAPAGFGDLVRERVGDRPAFLQLRRRLLRPGLRARHGHARDRRPELGEALEFVRALHGVGLARLRRGRGGAAVRLARPADGAPRRDRRLGGDLAARPGTGGGRGGAAHEALLRRRRARLREVLAQVPRRRAVLRGRHADHGRRHHRQADGAGGRDGRRPLRGERARPARDGRRRRPRRSREADPLQRLLPVPVRPHRVRAPARRPRVPRRRSSPSSWWTRSSAGSAWPRSGSPAPASAAT